MSEADTSAPTREEARSLLPPHLVLRDFLPAATVAALLAFAVAHEADFKPTGVGGDSDASPNRRIRRSLGLRRLGPFRRLLAARLRELTPRLTAELKATPFELARVELQLVAHGDGAFYRRHVDTTTGGEAGTLRTLSGVYYFHGEPRAFEGGALRLYAIGPGAARWVDIEPACNTLVVFPSWAPHEVMPVQCASGRFGDSRFAISCWLHQARR
ncbi:MAG TPA: 2OG-Fe(II) oxygenase [Caulobacteraceae bacterium]|nr:2OG-Fe(II) oxygenase [Caulobacteraceae bacterium]